MQQGRRRRYWVQAGHWTASAKRYWAVGEDDEELVHAPLVAIMMMTMMNMRKMRKEWYSGQSKEMFDTAWPPPPSPPPSPLLPPTPWSPQLPSTPPPPTPPPPPLPPPSSFLITSSLDTKAQTGACYVKEGVDTKVQLAQAWSSWSMKRHDMSWGWWYGCDDDPKPMAIEQKTERQTFTYCT